MTRMSRTLLALPAVFALMLPALPAMAATTTGYQQTPTPPSTTTTATTTSTAKPASGTGPSKETATPTTSTSPANTAMPHTTTTTHSTSSTLPFTGLDLRWIVGGGLLLLAAGLSLRFAQRRQRHDLGR
jgi:hypothetical protein